MQDPGTHVLPTRPARGRLRRRLALPTARRVAGTLCDNIVGGGCEPCTPQPPAISYVANGSSDCIGGSLTLPLGSWDLSLTSVAATDTDGGGNVTYFTPHGTLTATLVNAGDAGAESVTLSTCF